jgi:hypothetical protein
VNRILFVNGQVFDGTGTRPAPADVVVRGDRIESVRPRPGGGTTMDTASFERDNNPVQMGPDGPRPKKTGPEGVRAFWKLADQLTAA